MVRVENEERKSYLSRRITRRQAMRAGGIAALGLAFSKPVIETIRPNPVWAQVSFNPGGGPGSGTSFTVRIDVMQDYQVQVSNDPNFIDTPLGGGFLTIFRDGSTPPIINRGILYFDVSSLLGSTISSATLRMAHPTPFIHVAGFTAHQVLDPATGPLPTWDTATATWNNQPPHVATPESFGMVGSSVAETDFDVTGLVSGWVDGTFVNNGVMVKAGDETAVLSNFFAGFTGIFPAARLIVSGTS